MIECDGFPAFGAARRDASAEAPALLVYHGVDSILSQLGSAAQAAEASAADHHCRVPDHGRFGGCRSGHALRAAARQVATSGDLHEPVRLPHSDPHLVNRQQLTDELRRLPGRDFARSGSVPREFSTGSTVHAGLRQICLFSLP